MRLQWTRSGLADLVRLHEFLLPHDPRAAARIVRSLAAAPERLLQHPRIGERLTQYDPREGRRIRAGTYEIRYEIRGETISVLRLWHAREDR